MLTKRIISTAIWSSDTQGRRKDSVAPSLFGTVYIKDRNDIVKQVFEDKLFILGKKAGISVLFKKIADNKMIAKGNSNKEAVKLLYCPGKGIGWIKHK